MPAVRGRWKTLERELAKLLGGRRVPVTGRARGDAPDILHPWLAIEVKQRVALPGYLHDGMRQAEACAQPEQLPVVIMHQVGMRYRDAYVCVRLEDFTEWFGNGRQDG